ncbi:hypothetical protein CVD28_01030 [Bacillus sp. M6-12]|uniref:hypothetical protein n=1 Tax=Bacillus sp. M6-12 TaxID=2054166 RepID=UPI000C76607F|nr:hypothetical protein [Bacillus sp. M6-12]PLS19017.1 hypothetical protein CVD28_01030 [Bacillus sp. M6-12]
MFGFTKKETANHKSPTERYLEMCDELDEYKRKEKEWEREKQKYERGLSVFVDNEHLSPIIESILSQKIGKITLVTTVEPYEEEEEEVSEDDLPVAGIWYGVKVMNQEMEIAKILTLLDYDSCFVSEVATKRRRKNLFLATKVAEYIKVALESERMIDFILKEVELKEEILVGNALFNPEDKENVIRFEMNLNQE